MKSIRVLAACALAASFMTAGCSSITGTENQSISVQTRAQTGAEVVGAICELTNNKGKWFVTTPGSTSIHRSNDDMQVLCKKENLENGRAAVVSDTKGSMFGNIVFGGGIGAIVDHNNGSAYEYPAVIDIVMGSFAKIETPKNQSAQQNDLEPKQSRAVETSSNTPTNPPAPENHSSSDKLRDLLALRNDNVITEDEYQQKKKVLLEGL